VHDLPTSLTFSRPLKISRPLNEMFAQVFPGENCAELAAKIAGGQIPLSGLELKCDGNWN
jgi:hypothetical protein